MTIKIHSELITHLRILGPSFFRGISAANLEGLLDKIQKCRYEDLDSAKLVGQYLKGKIDALHEVSDMIYKHKENPLSQNGVHLN